MAGDRPKGAQGQVSPDHPYRGPELLIELVDHLAAALEARGIERSEARAGAVEAVREVTRVYGGGRVWIPRPAHNRSTLSWFEISARDLEVWRMYRRGNISDVCQRFGLSRAAVSKIVHRVRVERRAQLASLGMLRPTSAPGPTQGLICPDWK